LGIGFIDHLQIITTSNYNSLTELHTPNITATTAHMRCCQKVPGLGQKRNAGLTYSILAAISFKIVSLGMYTAVPLFFPPF
jgi:hypothetical protein